MKKVKLFIQRLVLVVTLILLSQSAFCQVTVNLNILPPYSPYFRDYLGYLNTKAVVTLFYTNAVAMQPLQVYLSASLRNEDNSITAQLRDEFRPAIPITLMPNVPQTLTGTQLRNIFGNSTGNDLTYTGISLNDVLMNQALPEGTYTICIKVKDFNTRSVIAESCNAMFISYCEPPQIYLPLNNTIEKEKKPQFVQVYWNPVTPAVRGISYRLRLVKLMNGITPTDALNYSTQVIFEKSNIRTTNFNLDLTSGVKLDTGAVYVMQVIASSPNAFIKNAGKSEPVQFLYQADYLATTSPTIPNDVNIKFLNPKYFTNKNSLDTLKVNNASDLLLNWCWLNSTELAEKANDTLLIDDTKYVKDYGIERYILTINNIENNKFRKINNNFVFTRIFSKQQNDKIENFLQLNDSASLKAGFQDGLIYRATLNAYDKTLKLIKSATSNNFIYKNIKDTDPVFNIPFQASIKYSFENFPEIYPVANTEITIEALKKQLNNPELNSLPSILIKDENYASICESTILSDSLGRVATKFAIPQKYFKNDSIYYRLKISNKYYVDTDFGIKGISVNSKDSVLNFGQFIAKTYAYKLKLNVTKKFTAYKLTKDENGLTVKLDNNVLGLYNSSNQKDDTNQSFTYGVDSTSVAIGIPVVLYRENKQANIPVYEGKISSGSGKLNIGLSKITVVGLGTTQLENGKTTVEFNKLLSTNLQSEEYKILAIKDLNTWLHANKKIKASINSGSLSNSNLSNKGLSNSNFQNQNLSTSNLENQSSGQFDLGSFASELTPELSGLLADAIDGMSSSNSKTNFIDSGGFVAEVMPFNLPLPANTSSQDIFYRTIEADYNIISCKPPTSVIRGRLFYSWKSDNNNLKRPLANTHFRVMVDYVDGSNVSIGSVTNQNKVFKGMGGSWEYTYFQKDGSDDVIPLVDQYATMAEGKTDGDGNFELEVVNFDKKGSLGSGTVSNSKGSSKPPVTGTNIKDELQNFGQEVINPWDQMGNDMGNQMGDEMGDKIGNQLNKGFNIGYNAGNQSFEVDGVKGTKAKTGGMAGGMVQAPVDVTHGPNPSPSPSYESTNEDAFTSKDYKDFKRIFRIVIDGEVGQYYYPSKDVITIQPYELQSSPINITHYVKEFKLKAYTIEKSNGKALPDMQVTLFRNITKPKNLPQGEGDGKYTYAELNNPEYASTSGVSNDTYNLNTNSIYGKKFEQLWPSQAVEAENNAYFAYMPALLQAQYDNYFLHSSSFVNKGAKTYKATIEDLPDFEDKNLDWTNPDIPIINVNVKLIPLSSRALVRVKDSVSGITLTSDQQARVMIADKQLVFTKNFILGAHKTLAVDKYGYAEFTTTSEPLSQFGLNDTNWKDIYFYAKAYGYNYSTQQQKAQYLINGVQSTPVIAVIPSSIIKGKIVTPDKKSFGTNIPVDVYLQADSGKIFESQNGSFEIPIAAIPGSKLKIIPKDVAYFDTSYVITLNDKNKALIDLNTINVYRRQHRIKFDVFTKAKQGSNIQTIRVKNATIQLGNQLASTDQFGSTKFQFENVSVNNYTFIVRGPEGQGYIPKTINMKSYETKDFVMQPIELEKGSEITGIVKLDGKPVKNAKVYIDVANTSSQSTLNLTEMTSQLNNNQAALNGNISGATTPKQQNIPLQGQAQSQSQSGINGQVQNYGANNYSVAGTGSITADANLVVAYTNAQGKYKLVGVPVNNQKINIIASLDTTFTVAGDKKEANIVSGSATTDLNITTFSQGTIDRLFGFPLTVEKITPLSNNQVKVTGLVKWTEALSDFNLEEVNKVLRVEDVTFDLVEKNQKKVGVVNGNSVKINGVTNLKLSYLNKYNVLLSASNSALGYNTQPLSIIKENDLGKISGKMQIVDNSFNYPSSYLNFDKSFFYLAKLNADTTINNIVSIATSAFTENESLSAERTDIKNYSQQVNTKVDNYRKQNNILYNLCDKDAQAIHFKLINFDATANPRKSYIDKTGKIHLNTDLDCYIPNAKPEKFKLNIDDMVLDENKVYPASSSKPISVSLEDWKLEVRNWEFSTTEGGILSKDAMIRTQIIDIPVGKFVLRHDMFFMDEFKMDKLALAGGKFPLIGVDPTKAHLNYEYKVGADMEPHWNFCLLSNGTTKVASLPDLAGLLNPASNGLIIPGNQFYKVDLNYIEILSNNEMIVQLMQKQVKARIKANPLAVFEPLSIYNGPNYISLTGALNIGAPRMGDISLTMQWTSPTNADINFENVTTDFEGKGFVHFTAKKDKITITPNQLTIEGKVVEKPNTTFNPIPSTLYAIAKGTPVYEVKMQKDWVTQLTEEESENLTTPKNSTAGYSLKIDKGGMMVSGNDWTTCTFEGLMKNNNPNAETKDDNIADCLTKFEVLGDISASSNSLAVSGLDTPFGSMSQTFDFKNKRLIGKLKLMSETTLGSVLVHSGTIETCFDPSGFYVAGGCNAYIPAGIFSGDYNTGFMAGSYKLTDHLWNVTNLYIDKAVVNKCYKASTPFLKGFYFAFNREIINVDISKNYILASGFVRAKAFLGGDFYVNAANGWTIGADGYIYVDVNAGLSAITGTSISGGVHGEGTVAFQINPTVLNATLKLGFNAKISQSLLFTTVSESISVDCSAKGGTDGFSFSLNGGGDELNCPTTSATK